MITIINYCSAGFKYQFKCSSKFYELTLQGDMVFSTIINRVHSESQHCLETNDSEGIVLCKVSTTLENTEENNSLVTFN